MKYLSMVAIMYVTGDKRIGSPPLGERLTNERGCARDNVAARYLNYVSNRSVMARSDLLDYLTTGSHNLNTLLYIKFSCLNVCNETPSEQGP